MKLGPHLYASRPVLPYAARRVPLLEPLVPYRPVQGLVPAHARGVLGTKVDQGGLRKKRKIKYF